MKILVTGGAGFIGSHVVDALINNNHEVFVVDNLSTGRKENLHPAARFYEIDIRDPELVQIFAAEQPEIICHLAAQVNVTRSITDPFTDAEINILGSLRLLECARQYQVRQVIFSSSVAVYGEPSYLPCDENHPTLPLSPYGVGKHTLERYLDLYHQLYSLSYTVLRYGNVYGPRQDPHGEAGVVSIFVDHLLAEQQPTIFGNGEQSRDFVYVEDVAQANLAALQLTSPTLTINISSGEQTTINTLYQQLAALADFIMPAHYAPARPGEIRHMVLSPALAQQKLNWKPAINLETGLHRTIDYYRHRQA